VDFNQLMTKLGRDGMVIVGGALLVFIDSFLPWYSVSFKGSADFPGTSGSTNGWGSGFGAWFPILLLVATGVVVTLAVMGTINWTALMTFTIATGVSALSFIIILLRWLTYPSLPAIYKGFASAGAGFGTYIGLVAALAMAIFGYLAFSAAGGSLSNIGAAFQPTPPQEQFPPNQG
jgi:hypothetical protein